MLFTAYMRANPCDTNKIDYKMNDIEYLLKGTGKELDCTDRSGNETTFFINHTQRKDNFLFPVFPRQRIIVAFLDPSSSDNPGSYPNFFFIAFYEAGSKGFSPAHEPGHKNPAALFT
jgi:hypothetical protein